MSLTKVLLIGTVLVAFASSTQAQVHYRQFRNTTGLNLIGKSTLIDNKIRLVSAVRHSRGNVWTQKAFPIAGGFRVSFAFQYTHLGGSTDDNGQVGNDGLLFYIQPLTNALQQDREIPPQSLLVFFDGYKNNNVGDISSSRIEVQVNGKILGQTDVEALGIRYREGKVQRVQVEYDGSRLAIFLNKKLLVTYANVDLSSLSPGYVGFHGMGGDAFADVDILNFHFEPGLFPSLPVSDMPQR